MTDTDYTDFELEGDEETPEFELRRPRRPGGCAFVVTLSGCCLEAWRPISLTDATELRDWLDKELAKIEAELARGAR